MPFPIAGKYGSLHCRPAVIAGLGSMQKNRIEYATEKSSYFYSGGRNRHSNHDFVHRAILGVCAAAKESHKRLHYYFILESGTISVHSTLLQAALRARGAQRLQGVYYRHNSRARANGILYNLLEKCRSASVGSRAFRNVVSGEDEPTTPLAVLVDYILHGLNFIPTFFPKISGQAVEVGLARIDRLPAASATQEMTSHPGLGERCRVANGVRKALESRAGNDSAESHAVLDDCGFVLLRCGSPWIAMRERMASQ